MELRLPLLVQIYGWPWHVIPTVAPHGSDLRLVQKCHTYGCPSWFRSTVGPEMSYLRLPLLVQIHGWSRNVIPTVAPLDLNLLLALKHDMKCVDWMFGKSSSNRLVRGRNILVERLAFIQMILFVAIITTSTATNGIISHGGWDFSIVTPASKCETVWWWYPSHYLTCRPSFLSRNM